MTKARGTALSGVLATAVLAALLYLPGEDPEEVDP